MKVTTSLLLFISVIGLSSCKSSLITSSGGYSDLSLTVNPSDYELKRLPELKSSTKQIVGIPLDKNVGLDHGYVNRYFSFSSAGTKDQNVAFYRAQPIITLVLTELPVLFLSRQLWRAQGFNTQTWETTHPYRGLAFMTFVLGSGVAAAYNNAVWDPSKRAIQRLNREVIEKNPEVDVFLNPKYSVKRTHGIFQSEATVTLNTLGATIKTDDKIEESPKKK